MHSRLRSDDELTLTTARNTEDVRTGLCFEELPYQIKKPALMERAGFVPLPAFLTILCCLFVRWRWR
jgi:hypothetical protein